MQYLLSKEELENLVPKRLLDESEVALEKARGLIVKHANVTQCGKGYCSDCPIGSVFKEDSLSRDVSKLICKNYRRYPK